MSSKKPASDEERSRAIFANDPDNLTGTMKRVGGSQSDHWNETVANQILQTLWTAHSKDETLNRQYNAVIAA